MFPSRTELLNRIYDHTLKTGNPLSLFRDAEDMEHLFTEEIQNDI